MRNASYQRHQLHLRVLVLSRCICPTVRVSCVGRAPPPFGPSRFLGLGPYPFEPPTLRTPTLRASTFSGFGPYPFEPLPSDPHPSGPHPSGPHVFWVWAPTPLSLPPFGSPPFGPPPFAPPRFLGLGPPPFGPQLSASPSRLSKSPAGLGCFKPLLRTRDSALPARSARSSKSQLRSNSSRFAASDNQEHLSGFGSWISRYRYPCRDTSSSQIFDAGVLLDF